MSTMYKSLCCIVLALTCVQCVDISPGSMDPTIIKANPSLRQKREATYTRPTFIEHGDDDTITRKLEDAFDSTMEMIEAVMNPGPSARSYYADILPQWFPLPGSDQIVRKDWSNIIGNPNMTNVGISLYDRYKQCNGNVAYTSNNLDNSAFILFCEDATRKALKEKLDGLDCTKIDGKVSSLLGTLEGIFFHEILHLANIVRTDVGVGPGHITDITYGIAKCLDLANSHPELALNNADSHMWFMAHLYWSNKCGKILKLPISNHVYQP